MNTRFLKNALLATAAVIALSAAAFPDPPAEQAQATAGTAKIVLAGGCFWGMEGVFESLRGVTNVISGYSGGAAATAHYEMVSTGMTGHAESVEITFNPAQISFGELLKVYFSIAHDPTELNYQGPDEGSQYRSAIFYTTPQQRDLAEAYVRELSVANVFKHPIVTQIVALHAFYPAEAYHQHFMQKNPNYPYIVYNDKPKLDELRRTYPNLVKSGA